MVFRESSTTFTRSEALSDAEQGVRQQPKGKLIATLTM